MEPQSKPEQWGEFQIALRSRVTPVTWQTWLEPLQPADVAGERVKLLAPSEFHLRWVIDKYLDPIEEAAAVAFGEMAVVELEASPDPILAGFEDSEDDGDDTDVGVPPSEPHHQPQPSEHSALVPKYQFENFVVGPSNRFAHAAAMAVSEQPGRHYNPLFIYGEAGLGKTHLLHAVGQQSRDLYPTMEARYVTSENFFNHFIEGIRRKRMDQFKDRYRNVDILLLDDVQFFEGKEQILEEFFHTFNALYESGKQLVISSDRHPKHLSTLEDRLRSRFEWGLLTDIQPPDVETRLAILRKNAEFAPRPVPKPVLEFIANHVSTNIRELEGALTRVTAYAALTSQSINLEMAQDVLQDLVAQSGAGRVVTPQDIINATSASFGVSTDDLCGPSRKQPLARARQIAMYLCRELTDLSLPKIGKEFGGRDHTTVMHGLDKVRQVMQSDQRIFDQVTALSQNLRRT
ncbi:MAG: chromosomal replication initiator protein DnaA [Acidimicrobiia bacterium]|nr:chromosomal replication initiator protein DnaA [Acidimicrobiia bacterium]